MNFDDAFDILIGHEGGYANHPKDPGGETMWGVTKRVAVASGYTGPMRDLPRDLAKGIYRKQYWDAVQADQLPDGVKFDVFDAAVNSGDKQAVKWLQRAGGALGGAPAGCALQRPAPAVHGRPSHLARFLARLGSPHRGKPHPIGGLNG